MFPEEERIITMKDRRAEHRMRFNFEGFAVFGGALNEVKIRDVTSTGVGLSSVANIKPGLRGVLFARLPSSCEMEQVPIKVSWCIARPQSSADPYQFLVGVNILK